MKWTLVAAIFAFFAGVGLAESAPDALTIVRRSVDRDWTDFEQLKDYTYQQSIDSRQLNKDGGLFKSQSETREIMILAGRPYERVVKRDGQPLSERDARREQTKMDRELTRRQQESAGDRAKLARERAEDRQFIREIPEAFNFKLLGTDTVSGQPAWVLDAEPKPGYRPRRSQAKMFQDVRAKIWIEQATYHWVKLDADVLDTISFGWGLLRVAPGGKIHFEQTRVNNEIWLPSAALIRADARLALIKRVRAEFDIHYSGYKKFQTESRIEGVHEK